MEYVVIRLGGKQYKVSKGDIIEVDRQKASDKGSLILDDVLLWVLDGKVNIGKPKVEAVKVKAKVLDEVKGEKIRVSKFKSKVRYRRVAGFRSILSRLKIDEIISKKLPD